TIKTPINVPTIVRATVNAPRITINGVLDTSSSIPGISALNPCRTLPIITIIITVMMGLQTRVLPLIRSNCCTGLVILPISDGFTVSVSSDMYNSSFYSYMYYNSSKILLVNLKSYLIPPPVSFSYYIMYRFDLYGILRKPYNHLNF